MRDAWDRARSTVGLQPRKCKRDDGIAGAERTASARGDDDELSSARLVRHRRGACPRGKIRLPYFAARLDVECPNRAVQRRADENNPTGRHDGTTKVYGSRKTAHGAERDVPGDVTGGEVHRDQRAEWRRCAGQSSGTQEDAPA